jgi:hypothetical protein
MQAKPCGMVNRLVRSGGRGAKKRAAQASGQKKTCEVAL